MPAHIGVIGSNMVDLVTYVDRMPKPGETLEAPQFAMGHGGKGANQAVAARKLGAQVTMVSRVGDDTFGQNTLRNFQDLGVNARHVRVTPGQASGVAPIFVNERTGENSILIVKGANDALSPADIDEAAPDLRQCDMILLQLETPLNTVYHAVDWAAQNNKTVLLNPAPANADLSLERIAHIDFFMPNQTELAILTGMPTETRPQAEAAAKSLLDRGMKTVVVTLGADGALLVQRDGTKHVASVPVHARDTAGAGDAFIGAFAQHYAESKDVNAALHSATRYAAQSVTAAGTQKSFPDRPAFQKFCIDLGEDVTG